MTQHAGNANQQEPAHSDSGLKGLLAVSWGYRLFGWAIRGSRTRKRLVQEHIMPFEGCRILDVGCGPGNLPAYLPGSIGEYCGIDMNPGYVETARRRWQARSTHTFLCQEVGIATAPKTDYYDIVTAIAIVHHLHDQDANRLFAVAHEALKRGGRLITYDCVYIDRQNRFARWLISKDRGTRVRTPAGYRALAARWFDDARGTIMHDTLRVPYTIFSMTCTKR